MKMEVLNLWNKEYPEKLNYKTLSGFESYLDNLTEQSHILMLNESQEIKGWYFDFIRDHKKWFAIILDSEIQGQGLGTQLLNLAKEKERELNGWVIDHHNNKKQNGETYKSPLDFYLRNGFELRSKDRLELDVISAVRIMWAK
jgi:GNAT superfamily N-acetyltransferase